MRKITKKLLGILSVSVLAVSMSGCTSADIKDVDPEVVSNLDSTRFNKMLDDTKFVLSQSDENLKIEDLKKRMTDVGLEMKTAQYVLAQKGYQEGKVDNLSFKTAVETVTIEDTWPRYAMFISQSVGEYSPYLVVFKQANPRDNYKISNWVRLFPKTSITSSNGINKGIELYGDKDKKLVDDPKTVLSNYLEYLMGNKKLNDKFEKDIFAEKFWEENSKVKEALKDIADVQVKMHDAKAEIVSFKLNDGSALMVTSFKYDVDFIRGANKKNGKVSGAMKALLGDNNEINTDITSTYSVSMSFIVPPKDAKDKKIKPIGAERVLSSVTRK